MIPFFYLSLLLCPEEEEVRRWFPYCSPGFSCLACPTSVPCRRERHVPTPESRVLLVFRGPPGRTFPPRPVSEPRSDVKGTTRTGDPEEILRRERNTGTSRTTSLMGVEVGPDRLRERRRSRVETERTPSEETVTGDNIRGFGWDPGGMSLTTRVDPRGSYLVPGHWGSWTVSRTGIGHNSIS